MEMVSVHPIQALAIVSQATQESHAKTFAPTCVVARESAQQGDACVLEVSSAWIAQSKHVAVAMEIVQSQELVFAILDSWVINARWQWNALTHHAVGMALARMAIVLAKLAFLVLRVPHLPQNVAHVLLVVNAIVRLGFVCVGPSHANSKLKLKKLLGVQEDLEVQVGPEVRVEVSLAALVDSVDHHQGQVEHHLVEGIKILISFQVPLAT